MNIKQTLQDSPIGDIITIAERIAHIGQLPDDDQTTHSLALQLQNMMRALNRLAKQTGDLKGGAE